MDLSPLVVRELVPVFSKKMLGMAISLPWQRCRPRPVGMDVYWPKKRLCWRGLKSLWPSSAQ